MFLLHILAACTPAAETHQDLDQDGYVDLVDCDDQDAAVHPGADELCDGLDNNCNGLTDDQDPGLLDGDWWWADLDGDGFAGEVLGTQACEQPEGHLLSAEDCDDLNSAAYPGGVEYCDGHDNDCDGEVDNDAVDGERLYADTDGDGYGDPGALLLTCETEVSGYVWDDQDCDDGDATVYPEAPDSYGDGVDSDCDGHDTPTPVQEDWFGDLSFGSTEAMEVFCGSYNRVLGSVAITGNVASTADLWCLTEVVGDLSVTSTALAELELPLLTSVSGNLSVEPGAVEVISLPSLVTVDGDVLHEDSTRTSPLVEVDLSSLVGSDGQIVLRAAALEVVDVSALEVAGDLILSSVTPVADLRLDSLQEVTGTLQVSGDDLSIPELVSASELYLGWSSGLDLPLLEVADYLSLSGPGEDLSDGLPALVEVGTLSVAVSGEAELAALETLGTLSIGGEVTGLSFPALTSIAGDLSFGSLNGLVWAELPALVSLGGDFSIKSAPVLEWVDVSALTQVDGVRIRTNRALTSVDLSALESVTNTVNVGETMGSVDLSSLTTIGLNLVLEYSDLTSISTWSSIDSVGNHFRFVGNESLPTEDIEALRDSIGTENIGGDITITNNG